MNLAWLLAVIQPRSIAPHPNFRDPDYEKLGPARLALIVRGSRFRGFLDPDEPLDGPEAALISLVEGCFDARRIGPSVASLRAEILTGRVDDLALLTGLTLVACASAAELDDFESCFELLDNALGNLRNQVGTEVSLCRAALLQQRALRSRDSGRPYGPACIEAGHAVRQFDPNGVTPFQLGPGTSSTSAEALAEVKESLLDAAASLMTSHMLASPDAAHLPNRKDRIRSGAAPVSVSADVDSARVFRRLTEKLYREALGSTAQAFGESATPDIFPTVFLLEANGHGDVYGARRDLALMRLLQSPDSESEKSDALRLLRQASAKSDLQLALRRLRAAGPLASLGADARQIIRSRLSRKLLGPMELIVLTEAAELLAPSEARAALEAVLNSLGADGPPDLPGQWQDPTLRRETAWVAASALAGACDAATVVASRLMGEVESVVARDELLDRAIRKAVIELDWMKVDDEVKDAWVELLRDKRDQFPAVEEAVLSTLNYPVRAPGGASQFEGVTYRLNNSIRLGTDWLPDPGDLAVVEEALKSTVAQLQPGVFVQSSTSVADVAAAAIELWSAEALWPPLLELLKNPLVGRRDRSAAFERLARGKATIPSDIAAEVSRAADGLLNENTSPNPFDGSQLIPYPEALRFLSARRLISPDVSYDAITALGGSLHVEARKEAALTVAVMAGTSQEDYLLGFALLFARDEDASVRAIAGRALATLPRANHSLGKVASRRLIELLREDGLLVPRQVLQALSELKEGLDSNVSNAVSGIATSHPSYRVRQAANDLLKE